MKAQRYVVQSAPKKGEVCAVLMNVQYHRLRLQNVCVNYITLRRQIQTPNFLELFARHLRELRPQALRYQCS